MISNLLFYTIKTIILIFTWCNVIVSCWCRSVAPDKNMLTIPNNQTLHLYWMHCLQQSHSSKVLYDAKQTFPRMWPCFNPISPSKNRPGVVFCFTLFLLSFQMQAHTPWILLECGPPEESHYLLMSFSSSLGGKPF